jgi:hypothetical protein
VTEERYGATSAEWAHFDLVLGLGPDLLPVVSNPGATISPTSKLKALGKVPSRYNRERHAAGISSWTSHVATPAELERWSTEPDYGICIQTRTVRAIDCDLADNVFAEEVRDAIGEFLRHELPTRRRLGSSKFLLAFTLPGDLPKRVIKTAHGIIEFLATGQQFIAIGTHPSGSRYIWEPALPSEIPALTLEQFDALWSALEAKFATEPSTTAKTSSKPEVLQAAVSSDPVAIELYARNLVKSTGTEGKIFITCPFEAEHERESDDTATTYFPANTGGYARGHFKCLHSPCEGRTDGDFLATIGIVEDHRDDFSAVAASVLETSAAALKTSTRFTLVPAMQFKAGVPPAWHIKNVVPHAELGVIFGEPGSGKSFYSFDMVAAVARGVPWRGHKTKRGRVVYVVAEGASGFRNRINAYCATHGIEELDLYILAAAPDFMEAKDIIELTNAIRALGPVSIVVVDTLARVSAGANENSGEDMGRVLGHCGTIHAVTGATVLLIHHSGKDASKGARGWSGIKGAVDFELEITREEQNRTAKVSKIKDGEGEGERFGFTLKTVSVGMDADGDDISSCIVEHGEVVAPREKAKRLGKRMDLVWQLVLDLQQPDNLGALEESIVVAYEAATPKPEGRDQRRAHALTAIESLAQMGRCRRVAPGRVVLTTQGE